VPFSSASLAGFAICLASSSVKSTKVCSTMVSAPAFDTKPSVFVVFKPFKNLITIANISGTYSPIYFKI
jgi:hypothetical protein